MQLFGSEIVKLIYAPHKAFKEIAKNMKYRGPILVMILFILASLGSEYARDSKIFVQQTLPVSLDPNNPSSWTQNASMWTSNAEISTTDKDTILGKSVQFNRSDAVDVWMELDNIGPIDCAVADGYKNITLSMKYTSSLGSIPQNLSLYLFSSSKTDNFYRNVTESINMTGTDDWVNFTVPLGPAAEGWLRSNADATWSSITGLRVEVMWENSSQSNLTVLISNLFFLSSRFEPWISYFSPVTSVFNAVIVFALNWMIFSLVLYGAARLSRVKSALRTFLMIIGYSLIGFVFLQIILGIFYYTIPPLYISLDTVFPVFVFQYIVTFGRYSALLVPIWSIVLAALGLRATFELPLTRSISLAVIGFIPYYLLFFFA